jgi:hypothetical protein
MFWSLASRRDVIVRALKTALLVGVILISVNHGDALLRGDVDLIRLLKMLVTFVVPYCVSTFASVSTLKNVEAIAGSSTNEK